MNDRANRTTEEQFLGINIDPLKLIEGLHELSRAFVGGNQGSYGMRIPAEKYRDGDLVCGSAGRLILRMMDRITELERDLRLAVSARDYANDMLDNARTPPADAGKVDAALRDIVSAYDRRSELFTNDADCAANLADRARRSLTGSPGEPRDGHAWYAVEGAAEGKWQGLPVKDVICINCGMVRPLFDCLNEQRPCARQAFSSMETALMSQSTARLQNIHALESELARISELADKLWKLCVDEGFPWADGSTQDELTELGLLYPKDMRNPADDSSDYCGSCDGDCKTCYRAVAHVRDARSPETKDGGV